MTLLCKEIVLSDVKLNFYSPSKTNILQLVIQVTHKKRSEMIFRKKWHEKVTFLKTIDRKDPSGKNLMELKVCDCLPTSSFPLSFLKVPSCRFQNLSICLLSFKNNTPKILHSLST